MDRRQQLRIPEIIDPKAIGFEPAKYILKVVYDKIFDSVPHPSASSSSTSTSTSSMSPREAHYRAVHGAILTKIKSVTIPINVLVGRDEANQAEQEYLERLGFSKRTADRLDNFRLLNPKMQIDDSLYLHSYCSTQQCFLYIRTKRVPFNHLSMPANPKFSRISEDHYKIHFKEEIPQERSGTFHYEFVPFDGQGKITINEGSAGSVFPNEEMVLSQETREKAQATTERVLRELKSAPTPKEAAELAQASTQASTQAPTQRKLTQRKPTQASIQALTQAPTQRKLTQRKPTQASTQASIQALTQAPTQRKLTQRKPTQASTQASIQALTQAPRKLTAKEEAAALEEELLRGFFTERKKKGGRLTRRRPRRRALRKTRRV